VTPVIRPLAPLLLLFLLLAGCNEATEKSQTAQTQPEPNRKPAQKLPLARCPADAASRCRSASGRVTYVEAVDRDGDGDAHLVLVSRQSVTAPGISVIDVPLNLRPRPLPRIGDRVSAAGPVYSGSYGQRQIEAVAINVARAGARP